MIELQHLGTYTKELKRHLPRRYFEPVPTRLLWMIPHLTVVVGGIASLAMYDFHWVIKLGIALLLGLSYSCLGFLAHEILHGSVVENAWLRNTLGGICFLPFNLGARLWRKWHNVEHHGHTQHAEDDPDAMAMLEDMENRPVLRMIFTSAPWLRSLMLFGSFTFWFSFHSFLMLLRFLKEFRTRDKPIVIGQFVLPLAFWIGMLVWLGPGPFVFAYVIPVTIANFTVMSYIATNHMLNALTPVNDPLVNSLTVTVPRWVDVLHLNFSHHTEHHIFPRMNPKYAPKVKHLAMKFWPERYNAMPHWKALLSLWRTPRLYHEHDHLVDPRRNLLYPTLSQGFDPDNIETKELRRDAKTIRVKGVSMVSQEDKI